MEKIQLIHPIYLDVPMLVSFAAAIQGGLSLEAEVTPIKETTKSGSAKVAGKFGLSNLFSNLFELTAETDVSGSLEGRSQEVRRESKSHTEASIAILLDDLLRKNSNHLILPKDASTLSHAFPGALVEVAGTLEKNAVDTVIDYVDAISILSSFAEPAAVTNLHHPNKFPARSLCPCRQPNLTRCERFWTKTAKGHRSQMSSYDVTNHLG